MNCPYRAKVYTGTRDGLSYNGNQGSRPNYEPNSFQPYKTETTHMESKLPMRGMATRYAPAHPNSDFAQAGTLYSKVMNAQQKTNLVENLVGHMKNARKDIQERQVRIFYKCNPEYGSRLAQGLGIPVNRMKL